MVRRVKGTGWQKLTGWSSDISWQCSGELHSGPPFWYALQYRLSLQGFSHPLEFLSHGHYWEGRWALTHLRLMQDVPHCSCTKTPIKAN